MTNSKRIYPINGETIKVNNKGKVIGVIPLTEGEIGRIFYLAKSMLDPNCKQFTYRDVILHFELCEKKLREQLQRDLNYKPHHDCWCSHLKQDILGDMK
jgi:hypothetical protein